MVKEQQFGKDHWSTLAFLETQIVDRTLPIDLRRMRVNDSKRGFSNGNMNIFPSDKSIHKWIDEWSTELKDGSLSSGHDDIDVVDDLEKFGYLNNNGTHINIIPKLTEKGLKVCNAIRKHKGEGGSFATFDLNMAGIVLESEYRHDRRYEVPFENEGAYADDEKDE